MSSGLECTDAHCGAVLFPMLSVDSLVSLNLVKLYTNASIAFSEYSKT